MYHKLDGKAESDVEADNYNCSYDEKESGSEHEEGDCSTCAQCECLSCTMSGPPCQPIDVSKSKHVYSHKSQHTAKKKSYSRSIQPSWYKKHPWITCNAFFMVAYSFYKSLTVLLLNVTKVYITLLPQYFLWLFVGACGLYPTQQTCLSLAYLDMLHTILYIIELTIFVP